MTRNADAPMQLGEKFWLCFCTAWFTSKKLLAEHLAQDHPTYKGGVQLLEAPAV